MNKVIILLFLLYSLLIIFIDNLYIIVSIIFLEFILLCLLKVKVKFKTTFYFLMIIFIFNFLLINFNIALLILLRLLSMYLIVILVINKIGVNNLAYTLANFFHSKDLYLIISMSLSFIPILRDEVFNLKKSLLVKNYECSFVNILRNPKIFVVTFFHNLFTRVKELEKTLIAAGYN